MFTFRLAFAFVVLLFVGACGSSPSPKAAASPAATSNEVLFAVVEGGSPGSQPGTVAIVGLDGKTRATATFQPRVGPVIPDAYTPLQGVAQVAGSAVYYIDGQGVVRMLRVGSEPQVIARFSLQHAQEDTWFAVSPDGSRVLAGIVTFPALGPIIKGTSWNSLLGPTKFDLESSVAGGLSKTLVHREAPEGASGPTPIFPVGWTSAGPVVMLPQYLTSQDNWPGGPLFLIDALGNQTQQLGGVDCLSASITSNGFIPCTTTTSQVVSVRDQAGKLAWTTGISGFGAWFTRVSADGQAILNDSQVETHAGGLVSLPQGFRVQGWLDSNKVVGRVQQQNGDQGDLSWISLGDSASLHDLGFKGDFISTLG
jgi:hypothetical protein